MSESQAKTMFVHCGWLGSRVGLPFLVKSDFPKGNGLDTDKIRAAFRLSLARDGLQF